MSDVELRSKTELTSIAGTENIYVQEAGSPYTVKRLLFSTLRSWINAFTVPIGTIIMYAKSTAPTNYLICNGAAISRSTYSDLYDVIGTVYGVGDGTTTFNLPDYRAVSPKGVGNQTINTRVKTGPASVGSLIEDTMQGFRMSPLSGTAYLMYVATGGAFNISGGTNFANISTTGDPITDGTNGTPRTGAQTQDCTIGTNFCIKYQ